MNNNSIFFIAYQDQENLGIGYLSSMLATHNYEVDIINIRSERQQIIQKIKDAEPLIVGFSLIFQFHLPLFRDLARDLRVNNVKSHFTVGGHYPSLRYHDTLTLIPEMDSIVRFEGEYTICELANCLQTGKNWKGIDGIAYRKNGRPISNKLRPMIDNLDALPFPMRRNQTEFNCMGVNYVTILASRGCIRNCSFCSVRKFYTTPPGKIRRTRTPKNVIEEMIFLNSKYGTKIFLFQDDDFILPGNVGRKWINEFLRELDKNGLNNSIIWKISCRVDEINADLIQDMISRGLFLVYFGLESGNDVGLSLLNKEITISDSIRAIELLKRLGVNYEYGFMLFDPSSTFDLVRKNINFLRRICGDGSAPIVLTKMLPLAETPIKKSLEAEGRLKGPSFSPDYDFTSPLMDMYCDFLTQLFHEWMFSHQGMLARLRWHRFEVSVLDKFYPHAIGISEYKKTLAEIIASSNKLFFQVAEEASKLFEEGASWYYNEIRDLKEYHRWELEAIMNRLFKEMQEFQKNQKK